MKYNIIILDDHPLITEGVERLLNQHPEMNLIGMVHSWPQLISEMTQFCPHILILDLNIKGKSILGNIDALHAQFPKIKILIFSSYNTPSLVKKAFEKQIDGYLLKDTTKTELVEALQLISKGETYIGERVAIRKKETDFAKPPSEVTDNFEKINQLTNREIEIMQLIVDGLDSKQIANQLFISLYTIQSHRKNILKKLDVHSVGELIKFAFENNLVKRK